jgi:acyl-CoA dehydrogenase
VADGRRGRRGREAGRDLAIAKAWSTEAMRRVVNDSMDIQGGAGISRGPRNTLAHVYSAVPIGITVEGANILTRSMIVFGQGAIRCHPYALKEMQAAQANDVEGFDAAFFGHVAFIAKNASRSFLLALTGGRLASSPVEGNAGRALEHLSRLSASFTLVSDFAMGTLGGSLKRKEMLSGRLADALAWMYVGSAAVKKFVAEGSPARDRALVRWATEEAAYQTQEALRGILENLPNRPAAWLLRALVFPLGARSASAVGPPVRDDRALDPRRRRDADGAVARHLRPAGLPIRASGGSSARCGLTDGVPHVAPADPRGGQGEGAAATPEQELYDLAVEKQVITPGQAASLREAAEARWDAIQVDAFDPAEYRALRG